jgi:uncharacterized protein YndB with AHSA1/START domain
MSEKTISKDAVVIERIFDAPVDLVWQMWTDPEHFKNWYGPEGLSIPVAEMDLRVGGKRLICMESADRSMTMWLVGEYTEIIPNERLVYTDSPADENGNVSMMNDEGQPLVSIVTVEFEDHDGRTKMLMTHTGLPANGRGGAKMGWGQSFAKMEKRIEAVLKSN